MLAWRQPCRAVMRLCFGRRCKFGEAKVAELHVTPSVIEDVGWLEILRVQAVALAVHSDTRRWAAAASQPCR